MFNLPTTSSLPGHSKASQRAYGWGPGGCGVLWRSGKFSWLIRPLGLCCFDQCEYPGWGTCHVWVKNCSDNHIFQPLYLEESCMGVFMSDELCCQQHHPAVPKALSFSVYEMKMYGLDGQQVTLSSNFLCFQTIHEEVGKTALGNVTSEWNLISGDKDEDSIIRCSSMARDTCLVWGQMRSMLERGTVTLETLNSLEKTFIVWDCQKMEWTKQEFFIFAHYAETITICPFFVVKSN